MYVSSGKNNLLFGLKTEKNPAQIDDNRENMERHQRAYLNLWLYSILDANSLLASRHSSFIIQALMHTLGSIRIVYMYVKMIIRTLKSTTKHQQSCGSFCGGAARGLWSPLT